MAPKEDAAAAMKRKADGGDSPAAKEAKVEKEEQEQEEKVEKVEKVEKFVEPDDEGDSRATLKETIGFDARETTLNVINTMGGRMLMMLSEGGMQYLLAGARANVGVKNGRYMYEVRMVEALTSAVTAGAGRTPALVKHLVRIGFSVGGSSLFLAGGGDAEADGVCFDSDGFWICPGQKKKEQGPIGQKFGKDNVMAIVLNLDPGSPNANTVTLFKDGVQVSQHMKLPEILKGKVLFPHVTYRNASIQVHFGPTALGPLPFKCRTLQGAACEDVKVEYTKKPKDGKYDVVFPVGVPDEGTFPWLEEFLKENPHHVEISDRKIVEWASKSGLWKPKGTNWKSSNDKPEFNFGIAALDDLSPQKIISIAAPLVPRHYVVMEVRGNLVPSIRKNTLKRFKSAHFRRIAKVMIGDPDKKYQEKVLGLALKQKQDQLDEEYKKKKTEIQRKRQLANRQKQLAEARKTAEEAAAKKKAAEEEAKKKRAADLMEKRAADAEARKQKEEEAAAKKAEEAAAKAEEKKAEDEKKAEEKKAEDEKKAAEKPELTEDEKKAEAEAKEEEEKAKKEEEEEAKKEEAEEAEKALKREEEKVAKAEKELEAKVAKAKKEELIKEAQNKAAEKKQEDDKRKAEEKQKKEEDDAKKDEQQQKDWDKEDAELCSVAVLTEEEKRVFFPKREQSDLTSGALSNSFFQFAVPDKAEGFDEVDCVWFGPTKAEEYLKSWVAERKITIRVEDLAPGPWFKGKFAGWQKAVEDWKLKQKRFKADAAKMNAMMARDTKEAKKGGASEEGEDSEKKEGDDAKTKEEQKEGEEKKEGEDAEMKDGEDSKKKEDDDAEKKDGEDVEMKEGAEAAEEPEEGVVASRAIDIWGVTDLSDIGNSEPLFLHFALEDWALMSLRFELNLMVRAFLHDTDDADRIGIPESHLAFYYNKYYNKQLSHSYYGADSVTTLVAMIKDVVGVDEKVPVLKSILEHPGEEENMDVFVKLTEEKRRERQRRIDAGDETVRLKFNIKAPTVVKSSMNEPKNPGQIVHPRPKGQAWSSPTSWKAAGAKPVGGKGAWKGGGKSGGWR